MILNEVVWIILGIIYMLQLPYWFYYLYVQFDLVFLLTKCLTKKKKKKVLLSLFGPVVQLCRAGSKLGLVSDCTSCVHVT